MGIFGGTLGRAIYGAADAAQKVGTDALENEFQQARQMTLAQVQAQTAQALATQKGGIDLSNQETLIPLKAKALADAEAHKSQVLGPGAQLVGPDGSIITSNMVAQKPQVVGPGYNLVGPDGTVLSANPTVTDPDKAALLKAQTDEANARAASLSKPPKAVQPNIKTVSDGNGGTYLVDQNSGAIGTPAPGTQAVPGQSHWFGADTPGSPATGPSISWTHNGVPLKNGLNDLYPSAPGSASGGASAGSGVNPPAKGFGDSKSGDVIFNGQSIGKASSQSEAANMLHSHVQGQTKAVAPPASPAPQAAPKSIPAAPAPQAAPVPSYQPPPGSFAAQVLAIRKKAVADVASRKAADQARVQQLQSQFNSDQTAMSPQALLQKWNASEGDLLPSQRSILFKARNPLITRHF